VPDCLESLVDIIRAGETERPLAELTYRDHFRLEPSREFHALAERHSPRRFYQGCPGERIAGNRPEQKRFNESGARNTVPVYSRRKDFRVIEHQAIVGIHPLRELAKMVIGPTLLDAIEDQHPRCCAILKRLLRDLFFRQMIVEVGDAHVDARISAYPEQMRILAIESSCDETAAAVVEDGIRVISSVVASQLSTHGKYGGVVPELASREHLRAIVPVVREALERAGTGLQGLAAIAVTEGPGLVGSLLVGITYAKALCFARDLPLIGVNHIEGHIHAVVMEARQSGEPVEFPALALVVSGGHTHLFEVLEGFRYRLLGKTRDDAAGEAYDKVAKLLGFGYPGGPVVDQLARYGNPKAVKFTLAKMKGNASDFSFSGLKTAVLRWFEAREMGGEVQARRELLRTTAVPSAEQWLGVTPRETLDLLASFQYTVVAELMRRLRGSSEEIGAQTIIVSGGVACNSGLREAAKTSWLPARTLFPTPGLSTDNAAMIGAAAFPKLERGDFADSTLSARANLTLA
jgi:N6-L-threonylcarbamoyladenine synthase